jgi:hypothetical protein
MNRIGFLLIILGFASPITAVAQQLQRAPISSQEYIQSVSPLASGGSVISRSTPGQPVQTITTIANLPSVSSQTPVVGYQPHQAYSGQWITNPTQVAANPQGYAYPSTTNGLLTQRPTNTLGLEPLGSRAFQQTRLFQSAPVNQYAQNCPTCVGGTTTNYPVQTYSPIQTPMNTGSTIYSPPPATLSAPTLTAPQPVPVPATGWTTPSLQYNFDPTWNPGYTPAPNRSNYTPIFALRNLPPGTYLGQGSLGQPKAYIDGEPIRNLLRYFSY